MMSRSLCPIWTVVVLGMAWTPSTARAQATPRDTVIVSFPAPAVRRWQVGLLRADRLQHMSLSMTLGLAAGLLSHRPVFAAYGSFGLGLAKELYDVRGSGFDAVDLCADAVGSGGAALAAHWIGE